VDRERLLAPFEILAVFDDRNRDVACVICPP